MSCPDNPEKCTYFLEGGICLEKSISNYNGDGSKPPEWIYCPFYDSSKQKVNENEN